MSRYGNYIHNRCIKCGEIKESGFYDCYLCKDLNKNDMKVDEIDKMLNKKDISPELKKALEQRKKILVNDKVISK